MKVRATRDFFSTTLGDRSEGEQFTVEPESLALHHIAQGRVVQVEESTYQTKVVREVPTVAGTANESSSLLADQASQKKTRGRPKKQAESSQLIAASGFVQMPTSSTQGTTSGGAPMSETGETSED